MYELGMLSNIICYSLPNTQYLTISLKSTFIFTPPRFLDNINIPIMMLNAVDDPIIAPVCSDVPIRIACQYEKVLHVQTQVSF